MPHPPEPSDEEITECLATLEKLRALDPSDPRFLRVENAAAFLRKQAKKKRKVKRRRAAANRDRELRVAIAEGRETKHARYHAERNCYVCKQPYRQVHDFYHLLCRACGDVSSAKRELTADLSGRRAIVTGGRIKIGYQTALRLLRAGAEVTVTTRFPTDAARRYAVEQDIASFRDRLTIVGLDFRALPDVIEQVERWRSGPPIDILINNAAQTVWHPPSYYEALDEGETRAPALPIERKSQPASSLALLPTSACALRNIDHGRVNSWVLDLEDVPTVEMVECQVVNAIVPFMLCSRLLPAMQKTQAPDRYIINVAALEGQFTRGDKLSRHPHTNMAKAALNMITKTSANAYAERGVYMVSVDPGWMSHEAPEEQKQRAHKQGFRPPLDAIDAAARICDPIARGVSGRPVFGVLLKDFAEVPW